MKAFRWLRVLTCALLLTALGATAARAAYYMKPPPGVNPNIAVQLSAGPLVTPGSNGLYSVTSLGDVKALLAQGWVVVYPAFTPTAVTGAITVDLSQGCTQSIGPMTGNVTLTTSNAAFCNGQQVILFFTQDGTGGRTVTFSTGFTSNENGIFPTIASAASATDVVAFGANATSVYYPAVGSAPILAAGCTFSVTLSSGVATTTLPCLAAFSHVMYAPNGAQPTGTGAPTPTGVAGNVKCAQAAANSTSLKCTSSSSADARVVDGFGY